MFDPRKDKPLTVEQTLTHLRDDGVGVGVNLEVVQQGFLSRHIFVSVYTLDEAYALRLVELAAPATEVVAPEPEPAPE
jgi:hypothetical protein